MLIPSTYSEDDPLFVRVAFWGGVQLLLIREATHEKDMVLGARVAVVEAPPMPLRRTACGLPGALSINASVPVRGPVAPGAKIMLIVQFAADATFGMQLSVSPKFVLAVMPTKFSIADP